jgi:hypothetical protein
VVRAGGEGDEGCAVDYEKQLTQAIVEQEKKKKKKKFIYFISCVFIHTFLIEKNQMCAEDSAQIQRGFSEYSVQIQRSAQIQREIK